MKLQNGCAMMLNTGRNRNQPPSMPAPNAPMEVISLVRSSSRCSIMDMVPVGSRSFLHRLSLSAMRSPTVLTGDPLHPVLRAHRAFLDLLEDRLHFLLEPPKR